MCLLRILEQKMKGVHKMPTPLTPQSLDAAVKKRENINVIRQSNDLIQRAHFDLSATEAKIWLYIVQQIRPTAQELGPMEFRIRDFCKLVGINPNSGASYKAIRMALKSIADSSLYIDLEGNGDETLLRWLSSVKMSKKSGTATIQISQEMRPFLLKLHERYTAISMPYAAGLHSKYAIRLYQLFKSYEYMNTPVVVTVSELRKMLKLPDCYNWGKIKQRVLDLAVEEICSSTDVLLSYKLNKQGATVKYVTFYMEKVPVEERDKRLSVVEARLGREWLSEIISVVPKEETEYDEIFENPPPENLTPSLIKYSSGSSKPSMTEVIKSKLQYHSLRDKLSESEVRTLDMLIKVLANLGNKHSKGEVLIDGGNKHNIDMINAVIETYGSLDKWFEAVIPKYDSIFKERGTVSNPVAYVVKSVANDLLYADIVIKNAEANKPKEGRRDVLFDRSLERKRCLKRKESS